MRRLAPQGTKKKPGIHQRWGPYSSSASSLGRTASSSGVNWRTGGARPSGGLGQIPYELIRKILSHFDPIEDKAVLARCLRVSKVMFHHAAPLLYRHVVAPGSLSPRLNPLQSLPKGVKWHDPTRPILAYPFQRETLLLLAETVSFPSAHRRVLQIVLERLAKDGKMKVIILDFQTKVESSREVELPVIKDKTQCPAGSGELPAGSLVWEGCPPWSYGNTACQLDAYRRTQPSNGNLVIKLRPMNDVETIITSPRCRDHGETNTKDSGLLQCPPCATVTLVFWTSRPTESWSQRSLAGHLPRAWDVHPSAPAWRTFVRSIARFLLLRTCDLLIVNAGAIDRLSAAESVWDQDVIQNKFSDDLERAITDCQRALSRIGNEPTVIEGRARFLTMREYINQEEWHGAFTSKEVQPWI